MEADSAGFSAGIAKCKASIKGFQGFMGNALGSIRSSLSGLGGTLVATLGAAGLGAAIKGSLDQLDRIDELSSTFGLATADLQKLSLIATQSGVDMDGLGKAATKLYKTLAENPDAFGNLGLSAKTLSAVDLPTKLGMIGDALNKIENDEQRVAAAMDVFGKSGADLLPLLQNGMEGIAKSAAGVHIFDDDDIAKAVAANDAIDRAKASLSSVVTDLSITLAPAIEAIADKLTGLSGSLHALEKWADKSGGDENTWMGAYNQKQDAWARMTKLERVGSLVGAKSAGTWLGDKIYGAGSGSGLEASQPYSAAEIAEFRRIREASERTADNLNAAGLAY